MNKKILASALSAAALVAIGTFLVVGKVGGSGAATQGSFDFTTIKKGDLEKTVSSSGPLEPVSTVSVLPQMSGRVEKVNADFNDKVVKGQVLVEINTDMLKLNREEQAAAVRVAQANYDLQLLDYTNKKKLAERSLTSDYELKSSETTLAVYGAQLDSAKAALAVIDTEISQYAFVKSPISGIVLERDVDVGQSVVEGSSSNSSSLFTLAEDLTKMQIKAEVDELDIASIAKGQKVRFTVEAYPDDEREGTVDEIRLVPETDDNVVTYYVIISADNGDGKLLPGMTAEVEFIEESLQDVLMVSNAALRFEPSGLSDEEIAKKVFLAGLPPDLSDQERKDAESRFDEMRAAAAAASSQTSSSGGLSSLVMGGGGGPGGAPMGGPPGGPGGRSSSSSRSASSTKSSDASTASASGSVSGTGDGGTPPGGDATAAQGGDAGAPLDPGTRKTLWYLDEKGELQVLVVTTGITDGSATQILSSQDLEGKQVIQKEKVQ